MVTKTEFIRSACQHCNGRFELPTEYLGSPVDCPHCGKSTIAAESDPQVVKEIPAMEKPAAPPEQTVSTVSLRARDHIGLSLAVVLFFGVPGFFAVLIGFLNMADSKTAFQQIASLLEIIGGVIALSLVFVVDLLARICGWLKQANQRLEELKERDR